MSIKKLTGPRPKNSHRGRPMSKLTTEILTTARSAKPEDTFVLSPEAGQNRDAMITAITTANRHLKDEGLKIRYQSDRQNDGGLLFWAEPLSTLREVQPPEPQGNVTPITKKAAPKAAAPKKAPPPRKR